MIIGNGKLITNDAESNFYDCGAVYVKDNVVEDIGEFEEIKSRYPDEEIVDVKGRVIMPGMICAHDHIYSSYARGMAVSRPTVDFFTTLENQWWTLDRSLTLEDVKLNAYTTYFEAVKAGTTTVIDHHSSPNCAEGSLFAIAEATEDLGIRASLCLELSDRDGKEIAEKEIKENVDFIKATQKDSKGDMLHGLFGMHASFTISDETMEKAVEAMEGVYDGYHVHVAEGIEDEYDSMKKYSKRVVERLEGYNILGPNTIAVHGVTVNEREMQILRDTKTNVVHNPQSNMNNAVGAPPISRMIDLGINVGIGTDAMTQDMFESVKVGTVLQSHETADPTRGFGEGAYMLFTGNQNICDRYFNKPLGRIQKGAYADIITVDYFPHTPMGSQNWVGHVLFGMSGGMVNDTMINGKFVMKDRIITTVDEMAIKAKSIERATEIWKNM